MTHTIRRDAPDTAVKPMIFSHETTDESVPRQASGQQAHDMRFSGHTPERADQPRR